jgi:hypothetical protein
MRKKLGKGRGNHLPELVVHDNPNRPPDVEMRKSSQVDTLSDDALPHKGGIPVALDVQDTVSQFKILSCKLSVCQRNLQGPRKAESNFYLIVSVTVDWRSGTKQNSFAPGLTASRWDGFGRR